MTLRDIRELASEPDAYAAEPIADAHGTVAVRTLMYDEGAEDRLITAGSYVFHASH